jgi:hypothetical protein
VRLFTVRRENIDMSRTQFPGGAERHFQAVSTQRTQRSVAAPWQPAPELGCSKGVDTLNARRFHKLSELSPQR